jgi:hypothetical protein
MPAKPISLGPVHFAKKEDAEEHLRTMLNKYDVGDKVSSQDAEVLMGAIERHPDARSKVGPGISHFSVRSADFGSQCFWVNRTDGTTEKFSYKSCIYP